MEEMELLEIIRCGETSSVQFKREFDNQDKIAAEMIAMANAKGGIIIFGIEDKTGNIVGLDYANLQSTNSKISTVANDLIKPQIYIFTEIVSIESDAGQKNILIVSIDEGIAKPQQSGRVFVDEMIIAEANIEDIDRKKVDDYIKRVTKNPDEYLKISDNVLYQNLHIIKKNNLTLGGLLFFSNEPQKYRPIFCVKAVSFYGNSIGGLNYRDSRDMTGTIPEMFRESISFLKMNLRHEQRGQDFNSVGILEISEIALEELVQNALIHRDYTRNSPVRIMIFDNRVEIVSPGCLPNSLTVENIKLGTAVVRNHLLASYASKLIKYKGLGSGIVRAINEQPNIEFINDESGDQFIVKIPREQVL